MPIRASGRIARTARAAAVCARCVWWAARSAVRPSGPPGCVPPDAVAHERVRPRLVEGDPVADPVPESVRHDCRVLRHALDDHRVGPAAGILERLRQVPVVERGPGLDAAGEEAVDEPVVEVEPGLVHRAAARRLDPRPGDAEPVGPQPELRHQVEIRLPATVVVAGDVTGVPVARATGRVRVHVPDARAAPVCRRGPLDLVRRGRGAPGEVGGKALSERTSGEQRRRHRSR